MKTNDSPIEKAMSENHCHCWDKCVCEEKFKVLEAERDRLKAANKINSDEYRQEIAHLKAELAKKTEEIYWLKLKEEKREENHEDCHCHDFKEELNGLETERNTIKSNLEYAQKRWDFYVEDRDLWKSKCEKFADAAKAAIEQAGNWKEKAERLAEESRALLNTGKCYCKPGIDFIKGYCSWCSVKSALAEFDQECGR